MYLFGQELLYQIWCNGSCFASEMLIIILRPLCRNMSVYVKCIVFFSESTIITIYRDCVIKQYYNFPVQMRD